MLCPRCRTETDHNICPVCHLDLDLQGEVTALQAEISGLRKSLETLTRQLSAKAVTGSDSPPKPSVVPPPLPSVAAAARPAPVPPRPVPQPVKPPQRTSSAETTVGRFVFLGIGVFVLLLAAGFFLKYAFDEKWIGPSFQISLGFVAGVFFFGFGEFCRARRWKGFDVAMAALGLGLLYLSAYAGNQFYGLLPDFLVLLITLLVTAIGLLRATAWNSRLLAGLCFLGGYLAPLLFSTGRISGWLFFGYLTVLNLGCQTLAFIKRWSLLYFLGSLLTWIAFSIWSGSTATAGHFWDRFLFTQLLFLLFSILPFFSFGRVTSMAQEITVPVAILNGWLCCWSTADLLHYERVPLALEGLCYATVAFVAALFLWRSRSRSHAASWLTAQGLVFLMLTWKAPENSQWTAVFWAAQSVAACWIAIQARDRILAVTSVLIAWAAVGQFIGSEVSQWSFPSSEAFTNSLGPRLLTGFIVVALFFVGTFLAWRRLDRWSSLGRWFEACGVLTLFYFFNIELVRLCSQFFKEATLAAISVLWTVFAMWLLAIGILFRRKRYRITAIIMLFVTVAKVLLWDTADFSAPYRILSCTVLGVLLIVASAVYYRLTPALLAGKDPNPGPK
jgi:uncharacterized membrane protein